MSKIIVITSGKGGVGKSNISLNTALRLSETGFRTCLFDGDLGLANANVLLGLEQEYTLDDVLFDRKKLEDIVLETRWGFDIIPGSSGVEKIANLSDTELEKLAGSFSQLTEYDYFLVDTASGISRNVISFCLASHETVIVITPETTSLTDAYALLKVLHTNKYKGNIRVLLNNCPDASIAKKTYSRYRKVVEKYLGITISPVGIILRDVHFEQAVARQQPLLSLYPHSTAASCITAFVSSLVSAMQETPTDSTIASFWTRYVTQIQSGSNNRSSKVLQKKPTSTAPDNDSPSVLPDPCLPSPFGVIRAAFSLLSRGAIAPAEARELILCDPALTVAALQMATTCTGQLTEDSIPIILFLDSVSPVQLHTLLLKTVMAATFDNVPPADGYSLDEHWVRSNHCALLARQLALKGGYPKPDDAYLCGLLLHVGEILPGEDLDTGNTFDPARSGADLLRSLQVDSMICDSVEFHRHPADQVRTALDLVRLAFIAHHLTRDNSPEFDPTDFLPGISGTDLQSLCVQTLKQSRELAEKFAIRTPEEQQGDDPFTCGNFRAQLLQYLFLQGVMPPLSPADTLSACLQRITNSMGTLFGFNHIVLFTLDNNRLTPHVIPGNSALAQLHGLTVPMATKNSVLIQACTSGSMTCTVAGTAIEPSCILDRQLESILGKGGMLCLPLRQAGHTVGLILCGLDGLGHELLDKKHDLLLQFAARAAQDLAVHLPKSPTQDR